jgi:formiminotetrahydrofolate cyclodeaminase
VSEESLAGFLERLAAGTPTPGSGAATALTGAAAAGLVAMACRVTARRAPGAHLDAAVREADTLRHRLLALGAEDARAYEAVIAARRAPEAERPEALAVALRSATQVPLDIARAAADVLALAAERVDDVRVAVLGEVGVALELASAAVAAAALTVRLNVAELDDPAFAGQVGAALGEAEAAARGTRDRLAARLGARTGLLRSKTAPR